MILRAVQIVPVAEALARRQQPVVVIPRVEGFETYVSHNDPDRPAFVVRASGPYVRIPLIAYRTPERSLAWLFATGFELGVRAQGQAARAVGRPPREFTLALGDACHDLPRDGAYRAYLGVAFHF